MTRVFSPRREDISSIHLRAIFDYWQTIRRDRAAPETSDFDPLGLLAVALRYIIVADVFARPFRVQYRLVGTHGIRSASLTCTAIAGPADAFRSNRLKNHGRSIACGNCSK
jgi:hypothetical protein